MARSIGQSYLVVCGSGRSRYKAPANVLGNIMKPTSRLIETTIPLKIPIICIEDLDQSVNEKPFKKMSQNNTYRNNSYHKPNGNRHETNGNRHETNGNRHEPNVNRREPYESVTPHHKTKSTSRKVNNNGVETFEIRDTVNTESSLSKNNTEKESIDRSDFCLDVSRNLERREQELLGKVSQVVISDDKSCSSNNDDDGDEMVETYSVDSPEVTEINHSTTENYQISDDEESVSETTDFICDGDQIVGETIHDDVVNLDDVSLFPTQIENGDIMIESSESSDSFQTAPDKETIDHSSDSFHTASDQETHDEATQSNGATNDFSTSVTKSSYKTVDKIKIECDADPPPFFTYLDTASVVKGRNRDKQLAKLSPIETPKEKMSASKSEPQCQSSDTDIDFDISLGKRLSRNKKIDRYTGLEKQNDEPQPLRKSQTKNSTVDLLSSSETSDSNSTQSNSISKFDNSKPIAKSISNPISKPPIQKSTVKDYIIDLLSHSEKSDSNSTRSNPLSKSSNSKPISKSISNPISKPVIHSQVSNSVPKSSHQTPKQSDGNESSNIGSESDSCKMINLAEIKRELEENKINIFGSNSFGFGDNDIDIFSSTEEGLQEPLDIEQLKLHYNIRALKVVISDIYRTKSKVGETIRRNSITPKNSKDQTSIDGGISASRNKIKKKISTAKNDGGDILKNVVVDITEIDDDNGKIKDVVDITGLDDDNSKKKGVDKLKTSTKYNKKLLGEKIMSYNIAQLNNEVKEVYTVNDVSGARSDGHSRQLFPKDVQKITEHDTVQHTTVNDDNERTSKKDDKYDDVYRKSKKSRHLSDDTTVNDDVERTSKKDDKYDDVYRKSKKSRHLSDDTTVNDDVERTSKKDDKNDDVYRKNKKSRRLSDASETDEMPTKMLRTSDDVPVKIHKSKEHEKKKKKKDKKKSDDTPDPPESGSLRGVSESFEERVAKKLAERNKRLGITAATYSRCRSPSPPKSSRKTSANELPPSPPRSPRKSLTIDAAPSNKRHPVAVQPSFVADASNKTSSTGNKKSSKPVEANKTTKTSQQSSHSKQNKSIPKSSSNTPQVTSRVPAQPTSLSIRGNTSVSLANSSRKTPTLSTNSPKKTPTLLTNSPRKTPTSLSLQGNVSSSLSPQKTPNSLTPSSASPTKNNQFMHPSMRMSLLAKKTNTEKSTPEVIPDTVPPKTQENKLLNHPSLRLSKKINTEPIVTNSGDPVVRISEQDTVSTTTRPKPRPRSRQIGSRGILLSPKSTKSRQPLWGNNNISLDSSMESECDVIGISDTESECSSNSTLVMTQVFHISSDDGSEIEADDTTTNNKTVDDSSLPNQSNDQMTTSSPVPNSEALTVSTTPAVSRDCEAINRLVTQTTPFECFIIPSDDEDDVQSLAEIRRRRKTSSKKRVETFVVKPTEIQPITKANTRPLLQPRTQIPFIEPVTEAPRVQIDNDAKKKTVPKTIKPAVRSVSQRQLRKLTEHFKLRNVEIKVVKLSNRNVRKLIKLCSKSTVWNAKDELRNAGLSKYDITRLGVQGLRKKSATSRYTFRQFLKKRDRYDFVDTENKRVKEIRRQQKQAERKRIEVISIRRALLKINARFMNQSRFWNYLQRKEQQKSVSSES